MAIFLEEAFTQSIGERKTTKWLNEKSKAMGINGRVIQEHFNNASGGMEICYESEVAWNELTNSMRIAEFQSLHEGVFQKIWDKIREWAQAVKKFFLRIWEAIKGFISNIFNKVSKGKAKEILKKLQEVKSHLKTDDKAKDIEIYGNLNVSATLTIYEGIFKNGRAKFDADLAKAKGIDPTKDPTKVATMLDGEAEDLKKVIDKMHNDAEKAEEEADKNAKPEKADRDVKAVEDGLQAVELEAKAIANFLKTKDVYVKTGILAADVAYAEAEKAEANVRDSAAASETESTAGNAKKAYDKKIAIAKLVCDASKYCINTAVKASQKLQNKANSNYAAWCSAGNKLIAIANKNKKESEKKD